MTLSRRDFIDRVRSKASNSGLSLSVTQLSSLGFLLAVLLNAGCTTGPAKGDPLCSEMARFANSVNDHGGRRVELLTDWGGVFSDDKNTLYEKTCKHDPDAPGKRLCDYLMENTSTEFATVNFRRALGCLGAQTYLGPPEAQVDYLSGKVTSYSVRGVRSDVEVSVEFSTGSSAQPPSLKITVEKTGS